MRRSLDAAGIPHLANASHIVPIPIGDAARCKAISDHLLDVYGIYVQPINYPTVPRGAERLRVTPNPHHTDADIAHLVAALGEVLAATDLRRAA